MPAVGKITLDIKDYEKSLAKARKEGQAFARGSAQDFKSVGNGASKAGRIISSMSSEAGGSLGKLGSIISAVASGPVVAMTAAFGALVALGVEVWDRLTLSAEEYAKKLDIASQAAEKNRAEVEKQAAEDETYMERLQELAKKETLSNEAKTEAATLIKNLTSRYGDLGLSIDAVTGKITGMDEAQAKFLRKQRENRAYALAEDIGALKQKSDNKIHQAIGYFSSMALTDEERAKIYNAPLTKQLQFAQDMFDRSKTNEDMTNWQEVIDLIQKRLKLERELQRLMETGAATEKELNDRQRKEAETTQKKVDEEISARNALEKKTEDYYTSTISNLEKQIELQKLINDGKHEEAERQKIINDLAGKGIAADARINTIMQMNRELGAAKLTQAQKAQSESLYDRALRAAGRGKEADTRAALENARKAKGGELTEEEKGRTLELLDLTRKLDDFKGASFGNLATQTNSLTARGGFSTGAAAPDADKYNRIIADNGKMMLSVVQRIEAICQKFGTF